MDKIKITMLGEFSVSYGEKTISENSKRSKKLWPLLQYLVAFHDRVVPQSELIELLWGDDKSDNPFGALKTQMHRLRTVLAELECDDAIIISSNGTYQLNPALQYAIDAESFESTFKASTVEQDKNHKLALLIKSINIYTGDFLVNSAYESWVVPITTYYRSLYTKATHMAIESLSLRGDLHDIIAICSKALSIDPYDEIIHFHQIKALAQLGEQKSAQRQYEYVTNLLLTKFGVSPTKELLNLYDQTIKTKKDIEMDIDIVIENLLEERKVEGAFFCEYQIFKHLYQLELRDSARTSKRISVCLLTVHTGEGGLPAQNPLNKAMERLSKSISSSLRGSDVYSRYSVSQFVVMLPETNDETGLLVMKRIEKNFKCENTNKDIELDFRFKSTSYDIVARFEKEVAVIDQM